MSHLLCKIIGHRFRFVYCHAECEVWCSTTLCCATCLRCGEGPGWRWYIEASNQESKS